MGALLLLLSAESPGDGRGAFLGAPGHISSLGGRWGVDSGVTLFLGVLMVVLVVGDAGVLGGVPIEAVALLAMLLLCLAYFRRQSLRYRTRSVSRVKANKNRIGLLEVEWEEEEVRRVACVLNE